MKLLLILLYVGALISLLLHALAYLKESQKQRSRDRQHANNDRCDYANLRPLETLLADIALTFGVISWIWFAAFILLG